MKQTFILGLAAMSMLTFASCEKEATTGKPQAEEVVEGIPTTATINLINSPSTMATEAGSAVENKVSDATLFVFNNADVLESIVQFNTEAVTAKKVTFQTTTGAKRLFVCANMNDKVTAWDFKTVTTSPSSPTTLDQFKKKQQTITFADIAADNNFWMTNLEKQPAQVIVGNNAATNTFTVTIGRACAKVSLAVGAGVAGSGGALSGISYKVMQNPDKMYLMPVYDGTNYTGKQLLTPYYSAATGTYLTGANISLGADPTQAKSTYMTENSNQSIMAKKATYLEVSGIWTPNLGQTKNPNGTAATVALTTGSDFWRIAKYDKAATETSKKIIGYKEGCYNAEPQISQVGVNEGAIKYTGGKCYYAIFVQDINAGTQDELPLRYTIKRNTFFKVVISSISGPGAGTEDQAVPDPDKPVEEKIEMTVNITVADWTIADLNAGI